ncbi:MAG: Branched-chain-amino-acid aminotransferase [Chlamydiae bacterium]|nr:Branched-chain-amino-acid aminotransferase [Chlamydiota bacterium]
MNSTKSPLLPFCYFNQKIVPHQEAKLSIMSQSIQYGATCFAGLRGYYRGDKIAIFRLQDHFKRLMNGAKIIGMSVDMELSEFEDILKQLIEKNQPKGDIYIRPFLYTDDDYVGPRFDRSPFFVAVYMINLNNYMDPDIGLRLMISSWRKYSDSAVSVKAKAGGVYLNSALATTEARKNGYDEALLLDHDDYLCEASIANVLISYQNELYSPQVGGGSLDGWTLRTALQILEDENIEVKRELVDRSMIYSAEEVILTGTAAQILFGGSVDGRPIKDGQQGPICKLLRKRFKEIISGKHPRSKKWLTEF